MNRIQNLIHKLLQNTVTEQELKELSELLNDPSNHREAERIITNRYKLHRTEKEGLTQTESFQMIENIISSTRSKPSAKTKRFRLLITITAIAVLATTGVWINNGNLSDQINARHKSSIKTLSGKDYVHLPDGSTVFLNEGSELSYSFTDSGRNVTLRGEAYFDVAHNSSKPFRVFTGKIVTTVLGTAFNVNANSAQNVVITVTRGKVTVGDQTRVYEMITPDEQIAVNTTDNKFTKNKVNSQLIVEWRNKYFILDDMTFEQAALEIERKFNVKVVIQNENLKKCKVHAWFMNNESLDEVIEDISSSMLVTGRIKGKTVVIEGGQGCQ